MGWIILSAVAAIVLALLILVIIILHLLVSADKKSKLAMSQIGEKIAKRYDAIMNLLSLAEVYDKNECDEILSTIKKTSSKVINSSDVSDVVQREKILSQAVEKLHELIEKYPEIKSNQQYLMELDTANSYDNSVKKTKIEYNNNAEKLNTLTSVFPSSVFARIMHITRQEGRFDL